jgi:uncharacterized protein involved in exopolysaccharide biosynthesis
MAGYKAGVTLTGPRGALSPGRNPWPSEVPRPRAIGTGPGGGTGNGHGVGGATSGNGGHLSAGPENGNGNGHVTKNGNGNGNGGNGNGGNGHGAGGNGHGSGGSGPARVRVHAASAKEQLFEILHVIFKRWRMIGGLFAFIALAGTLGVLARGPQYLAAGKVLITDDRADATIQPTAQASLDLMKLNESVVNSEVHLIQSRELIEQVVRGLALARAGGNVVNIANAADDHEAITSRASRISTRVKVTPIKSTNIIEIDFPSGDASEATQVVNRMIDEYLAYHAMVHSQPGLSGFYEEQSTTLMQNLRHAEDALSQFALREGIVSPTAEIQAAVTGVANTETELRTRSANVVGIEEKLRLVRDQLAAQPDVMKRQQQLEVNPVLKQLREQLTDRNVDQIALLRKYTENDRHVQDNQTEINELNSRLNKEAASEAMTVASETYAANPVYEARLGAMLDLEAELRENRATKIALEEDLARQRRQIVDLKQRALEFDHLDAELQRQRTSVDLYTRRQEEAVIEDAMDQRKLVNVAVVQRPGLPLPRSDNLKLSLALAVAAGLAVAFGGAFGLEYLNRTVRFERDVERYLGLPVLGTVAEVKK